jgi:phosphoglucomutase
MSISPLAGKLADPSTLADIPRLITAYYVERPDPAVKEQLVTFGTSGHHGSSIQRTFNEWHILAISQAICAHRKAEGIDGPLFIGCDTHALSQPAFASAMEVLAANSVEVIVSANDDPTPTPTVSHAILTYNRNRKSGLADGIVITPSHNPPEDGGFKYNPPNGGPAGSEITGGIQNQANDFLASGLNGVRRISFDQAMHASTTHRHDYRSAYVADLENVLDFDAIRAAGLHLGVDPWAAPGELLAGDCRPLSAEPYRGQQND